MYILEKKVRSGSKEDYFNSKSIEVHNERVETFKDHYAQELDNHYKSAFTFGRKKIKDCLDKYISKLKGGSLVLDIGCGTGFFLNYLYTKNMKAFGVDLAQEMLKTLKACHPNASVQRANGTRLPFTENTFDCVISIETLRYFKYPDRLLKEIYRVLKPSGMAFVTAAPLFSTHLYSFYNIFCQKINWKKGVSCYQSFETKNSFKRSLSRAGFSDVDIKGYFYGPYCILDKIQPSWSSFFLKKGEPLDNWLCQFQFLNSCSNHLVGVVKKPSLY